VVAVVGEEVVDSENVSARHAFEATRALSRHLKTVSVHLVVIGDVSFNDSVHPAVFIFWAVNAGRIDSFGGVQVLSVVAVFGHNSTG